MQADIFSLQGNELILSDVTVDLNEVGERWYGTIYVPTGRLLPQARYRFKLADGRLGEIQVTRLNSFRQVGLAASFDGIGQLQ